MARLRTPGCTTAVRDSLSSRTMRLNLRQRQGHAQAVRHGAAGQAGARAARHHRHAQRVAGLEHSRHLRLGLGQRHHQRRSR
jgi:hypothetical protein